MARKTTKKAAPKSKAKPKVKLKNEGQRLFAEVEGIDADLAKQIGCGPAIVGHWRLGRRTPSDAFRHKLELLFGIPQRAWDVLPGSSPSPSTSPSKAKKNPSKDDDVLYITNEQIEEIRAALKDNKLTDAAASRMRDTLTKTLAIRVRIERDREMLEDRAVREHPEWKNLKEAILAALKPFPEAAAAVVEALK